MKFLFLLMMVPLTSLSADQIPDELDIYDVNKQIPPVIRANVLKALSFYPELKETKIDFVFKQNIKKSVMQAQPKFKFLFTDKRAYQINISALFKLTHAAIPIHQIPDRIMIGWIGHELGHVLDYENRSDLGLLSFGIRYLLFDGFVKRAELIADTYAVNHGLGPYIIETKEFILSHTDLSDDYKEKISRLYLSPDDIVKQVKKLEEKRAAKELP